MFDLRQKFYAKRDMAGGAIADEPNDSAIHKPENVKFTITGIAQGLAVPARPLRIGVVTSLDNLFAPLLCLLFPQGHVIGKTPRYLGANPTVLNDR
jgi:hypothetical protein